MSDLRATCADHIERCRAVVARLDAIRAADPFAMMERSNRDPAFRARIKRLEQARRDQANAAIDAAMARYWAKREAVL